MKKYLAATLLVVIYGCKEEKPQKPQNDYYTNGGWNGYSSGNYTNYGNSGYYDYNSTNGTNMYDSAYGTYNSFNNSTNPYNYGANNFDCSQLYGSTYGNQNNSGLGTGLGTNTFNSGLGQYSNPMVDCSQYNSLNQFQYQYQDPLLYGQQNMQNQQQFYNRMLDTQRDMSLIGMIPSVIGALTGNQTIMTQGLLPQNQMMYMNPQVYSPGMGLSGFNGQFSNFNNPFFQQQNLMMGNQQIQPGMTNQFGQYSYMNQYGNQGYNQNYNQYGQVNNQLGNQQYTDQYSNRLFYDDPNFSNGLSGRNAFYSPMNNF